MESPDKPKSKSVNIGLDQADKSELLKNWKVIENILIYVAIIGISFPIFIILHRNLPNVDWKYNLDRILLYILILSMLLFLVKFVRRIFVILCIVFILFIGLETLKGEYGFIALAEDYQAMIHSMSDSDKPQKVFLNKITFNSSNAQILKAIDYTDPEVRNFALEATNKYFKEYQNDKRYRALIQSFAIFKEINSNWNYVNDPVGHEYYAKATESIKILSGDCDDYSILMAACIRVIGGTPRLVYTVGHIYPEIYIGDEGDLESINYLIKNKLFLEESNGKSLYYHIDQDGKIWLNLDYTAQYPGGPFMKEEVLDVIETTE